MDGVVLDLHTRWISWYNQQCDDSLKTEDITEYDLTKFVRPGQERLVKDGFRQPSMFTNLVSLPGAINAVNAINELGYDITFVSTIPRNCYEARAKNMYMWFSELDYELIFASLFYRRNISADIVIDDSPDNLRLYRAQHVICYAQPWNAKLSKDYYDLRGKWPDILKYIFKNTYGDIRNATP